jgi:hypothetical protein
MPAASKPELMFTTTMRGHGNNMQRSPELLQNFHGMAKVQG